MKRIKGIIALVKDFFKKLNYRHYICVGITAAFVLISVFVFPHAFGRVGESFRDIGNSAVFYVNFLFSLDLHGSITVTQYSAMPFEMPFNLPNTWEEFKLAWAQYWQIVFTPENLQAYLKLLVDILYYLSKIVLCVLPVIALFVLVKLLLPRNQNNDYNKDSKALKAWKRFEKVVYVPVKTWVQDFVRFTAEHGAYVKLWFAIWAFNFNLFSILLEFIAFYLYFVASFAVLDIYKQALKLLIDLSVAINFIPLVGWLFLGWLLMNYTRRKIGYARLNRYELRNRGFINERPIVMLVCASMGKGKTTMITDMALSQEIMFRDTAFEKLLQHDLKFPFFPWINLENAIKHAMEIHYVYNLASCKRFVRSLRRAWRKGKDSAIFGYDWERYGLETDNKLYIENLWQVIENYTQLYFIYVIESSLMISNYSIRTDFILQTVGNFPLWHSDLFKTDSRMIDAFSRHSHILDFNTLRLGLRIIDKNKDADGFEFGIINITEIGKERGNNLELQEKKKNADEANQKNDLFNYSLKMIRHSATVDNFPFVRVITDEQRPESWGADARDLCDIIHIDERSERRLAMPLFAISDLLIDWALNKFTSKYYDYRYDRGDNTLPMYLYHGFVSMLDKYRIGIYHTFGYKQLNLLVECGTQDGAQSKKKYYEMEQKIHRKRFSTDAFSDYFNQKALLSSIGINDIPEFMTEKATWDELLSENSYFFNDLAKIKDKIDKK